MTVLIRIISIFPDLFEGLFKYGIIQQAIKKELLKIDPVDLRDFADDRHRTVDDRPYGGGEGMVLKPEPLSRAIDYCRQTGPQPTRVVLLSPQGALFDQGKAKELSLLAQLVPVCGRYEGVDQRVVEHCVDEEISIGDFVLSGGELAAAVIVDAVSRLIPGVVGKGSSVLEDSFMEGLLDFPHYTRPAEYRGWRVPEVLLSGDHARIQKWRRREALQRTMVRRPDLLSSQSIEEAKEDTDESSGTG